MEKRKLPRPLPAPATQDNGDADTPGSKFLRNARFPTADPTPTATGPTPDKKGDMIADAPSDSPNGPSLFDANNDPHRVPPGSVFTPSQQRILEEAAKTGDLNSAIRHERPQISRVRHYEVKKRIEQKMRQVLDRAGLTDRVLVERYLKPALKALDSRFLPGKKMGEYTERHPPAWKIRVAALQMALELGGHFPPKPVLQVDANVNLGLADRIQQARMRVAELPSG